MIPDMMFFLPALVATFRNKMLTCSVKFNYEEYVENNTLT